MQTPIEPLEQRGRAAGRRPAMPNMRISHEFDDLDVHAFTEVAARFGCRTYGFVVTPNVDHMIRCHEDASYRSILSKASYILLDSRFANRLFRILKRRDFPICTGADLSQQLLTAVIEPEDRIVLIGATETQACLLKSLFGLNNLAHYNPPMGFIHNAAAVEKCLEFVEQSSPFRFCFLAVGSPQQEIFAEKLMDRNRARGLALCVGASINFVTGGEKRAPKWMQDMALEWLYRLLQNPNRMAYRYLVRGPRIFRYLLRAHVVARAPMSPPVADDDISLAETSG